MKNNSKLYTVATKESTHALLKEDAERLYRKYRASGIKTELKKHNVSDI